MQHVTKTLIPLHKLDAFHRSYRKMTLLKVEKNILIVCAQNPRIIMKHRKSWEACE